MDPDRLGGDLLRDRIHDPLLERMVRRRSVLIGKGVELIDQGVEFRVVVLEVVLVHGVTSLAGGVDFGGLVLSSGFNMALSFLSAR